MTRPRSSDSDSPLREPQPFLLTHRALQSAACLQPRPLQNAQTIPSPERSSHWPSVTQRSSWRSNARHISPTRFTGAYPREHSGEHAEAGRTPGNSWSQGLTPLWEKGAAVAWVPHIHPGSEEQKGQDHQRIVLEEWAETREVNEQSQDPSHSLLSPCAMLPLPRAARTPPWSQRVTYRQGLGQRA